MKFLVAFIRFILYLSSVKGELRKAQACEKAGDIEKRKEIVLDVVQNWARFVVLLSNKKTRVIVEGEENLIQDRAVVFVANHQSYFDIPCMLGYIRKPFAFIAKKEVKKIPLIPAWMELMQCVFIDRNNPRQSVQAMKQAVENVKNGYSLVIFPEGTRSKNGEVNEFKAGSFKLALKSKAPIIPVTILGTRAMYEESGLKAGLVTIKLHKPIFIDDLTKEDSDALPEKVRQVVIQGIP
ncbi:MAG: lysophospholipid acyltransferase family protein [Treponemataceae bacterium]